MSNRIRVKTIVPLLEINKPSPVITRDAAERIIQWVYTYLSVTVTYNVVWAEPSGSAVVSVTPTITDN